MFVIGFGSNSTQFSTLYRSCADKSELRYQVHISPMYISYSDAADLVELHLLCHPESEFAKGLQREGGRPTGQQLVEVGLQMEGGRPTGQQLVEVKGGRSES